MDWNRRIFGYCERGQDPAFWAEPLNAVTNGAFLLAAIVVLIAALKRGRLDGPVAVLVVLLTAISVGSFLFHTLAVVWAAVMDSAPIGLFILSYFAIAMNRYGGFGWGWAALLTLGFIVALVGTSWVLRPVLLPVIGGSVSYVPPLLGLIGVGIWLAARRHPAAGWLIAAAAIFAVSLTFRALDQSVCADLPAGTHFLWHVLNAVVLGTLALALVRHGARVDARGGLD